MIVAGSFGLILADYFGWPITYLVMAGFMLVGMVAVITIAPTVTIVKPTNLNWHQIIWEPLGNFLKKDKAILILLLIPMYKIGDVCSHALVTPFLLDLNFSLTEVGTINKLVSAAASLVGIMLAGIVMTKVNLFRSLLFFGCLQGISNLLYMLLAIVGKNYYIAIIAFFIENLCSGMGNAALVALIMSLCSKEFSGTQYALLSSLTAIG
jgi:MFS transporter, PAT family, beta-lactamase induction signal transducer AmpG